MPVILFESPGSEEFTRTEKLGVGAEFVLSSRYNLDLPYSNGIRSVSLHKLTLKVIKISRGEVELEVVGARDSFIEKEGRRLLVSDKIV